MTVERTRQGRVLVITLQREAKRNAIDEETALGIDGALNELEDDDELWVGVITGGREVFSAGTDLRVGSGAGTERGGPYGIIRRRRSKPLIAAVEGFAFGGGMEIVLACDLVVASSTARFGLPEVRRGLLALYGGVFRSARALPLNLAKEIVLTGDPIDATRAERHGMVNVVTEPGAALDGALALAERICANAPVAVRQSLELLEACTAPDETAWTLSGQAMEVVMASEDAREGRQAFLERRSPQWRGR
ncbi:MAG TPA: enoyl-CoA hydratase-related protein [Acidimicrobiales bacterium]|nr:enoyl-CoA hydratase-related protein [Acidimicrobiales bacterium]